MSTAPTTSTSTSTFLYRIGILTMTLALGYLAKAFRRTKYTAKKAQEDLLVLRKAIESRDTEMASLHRSVEATKEDARDRIEGLAHEIEGLRSRLRATEGELEEACEGRRALEAALTEREGQEREWFAEKTRLETEYQDVLGVLEAKSAELENAQRSSLMLREKDRLTDQAVLLLVQQLNAKITETATELAEAFEFQETKDAMPESEEMAEVYERATEILGHELVTILRTSDHHEDPALVRLAFQSGMIEYARWMSASWFFEDPEDEQLIVDIYQRVRTAHNQVVAGRWRALTHKHVQELIHGEPELADYFVDAFVNVLLTAGFKSSSAALHALVAQRFGDRISALVQLALGLNKAVGTEVTACELKTLSAAPGVPFDAETMIDIVDGVAQPGEAVLCTCELGLSRSDKNDGVWTRTILLEPKVVLPSGLEELLGRTPTKTKAGVFTQ
ncbi:hypothetical protein B0H12DRAFT_1103404 [Mycena haematopus]|nr:hypothetical protein B0H12DRAFT_1103404 [Mycena haematopus]